MPIPNQPNERVHIDLFGPLKTSSEGNKFILVITDAFTKYAVISAIPNKEAETVARALFDRWISLFSCMKTLVSDNGKEFCNKIMDHLSKRFNIQRRTTSAHHPQSNVAAEAFNRTIIKYLKTHLENQTLDWQEWLPAIMIAYNTQIHKAMKTSPFFALFTRDPQLPYFDFDDRVHFTENWAEEQFIRARQAWKQIKLNLEKANYNQALTAQQSEKERSLQIGQNVLLRIPNPPPGVNAKLYQPWEDHYIIVARAGPVTYLVHNKKTKRNTLVHIDRLKSALPVKKESTLNIPKRVSSTINKQVPKKSKTMSDSEDFGEEFFLLTQENVEHLLQNLRRTDLRGEDLRRPRDHTEDSHHSTSSDDSYGSAGSFEEHSGQRDQRSGHGHTLQSPGANSDHDDRSLLGYQRHSNVNQAGTSGLPGNARPDDTLPTNQPRHRPDSPILRLATNKSNSSSSSSFDTIPEFGDDDTNSEDTTSIQNDMEKEDQKGKKKKHGRPGLPVHDKTKTPTKNQTQKIPGPITGSLTRRRVKTMGLNLNDFPWNT